MTTTLIAGPGAKRADGLLLHLTKLGPTWLHEDPLSLTVDRLRERSVSAVVYLPDPGHWHGMRSEAHAFKGLLDACNEAGVAKLVLLSCHRVYGASSQHSLFLPETTAWSTNDPCPAVRDLVAIDQAAMGRVHNGAVRVVVLRPVYVLGGALGSSLEPYLSAKFVPAVFGFDPMVQLVSALDLQRAIELVLSHPELEGAYNVTGAGSVPLSVVARERGVKRTRLVGRLGLMLNEWAVRAGHSRMPNTALSFLTHVLSVDGSRFAAATGYRPRVPLVPLVSGTECTQEEKGASVRPVASAKEPAHAPQRA